MGCDVDGDIRLDFAQNGETVNQREYRLIQVCLFGQWSYVCNWIFDHQDVDSSVVLQQLQCQNGGRDVPVFMYFTTNLVLLFIIILETTARSGTSSLTPAYLTRMD